MKKRLIISCVNLLLLLIVGGSCVYAWYTNGQNTAKVTITTANLATEVILYKGNDFNHDGNLDLTSVTTDSGTSIVESFTEVSTKTKDQKYLTLVFDDVIPTEIHTWKFEVRNLGEADGYFSIHLNEDIFDTVATGSTYTYHDLVKFMSVSYYRINTSGTVKFSDKSYLYNVKSDNTFVCGNHEKDLVKLSTTESFVVRFELETFENFCLNVLKIDVNSSTLTTEQKTLINNLETEYQELQGKLLVAGSSSSEIYNFIEVVLSS